jgi:methyltransferase (TIGR00027 family)
MPVGSQGSQHAGKRSAEFVAAFRAVGARDPEINNPDVLAHRMLSAPLRLLTGPGLRRLARASSNRKVPGMYLYHQARTQHFDEVFLEGTAEVGQVVVLGAGLDTRPYRFAEQLAGKRVIEVDHPGTAAWKHRRLARAGVPTEHVTYATTDFTREALDEVLLAAGYTTNEPAFFLWEGVVMYLPAAAVEATLQMIGRAAIGSQVAFDYVFQAAIADPDRFLGARQFQDQVARRDEPVLFGLDPDAVDAFLEPFGLSIVSHAGPAELAQRVAPTPMCDFFGIVHARRADVQI